MFDVSFSEVIFQTFILAAQTCGLLVLWRFFKNIGENHSMLPGQDYFSALVLCGIGAWVLHGQFSVELTSAWVAFMATGLASWFGLMKGNSLRHQKEYDKKADYNLKKPNHIVPTICGFLIISGLSTAFYAGYCWLMSAIFSK